MILFKQEHVGLILEGSKTQTRRLWKRPRARVGSVHQCRTSYFAEPFARIRILNVQQQHLGDITDADALAEGGYTVSDYIDVWMRINGNGSWNPAEVVTVVDFELAA